MQIEQQEIIISTPDGEMPAFLATPADNQIKPAAIVLMEAFGLTQHIKDITLRIANEGYIAIAPDLYYRALPNNKFGYDEVESARSMMYGLVFEKTVDEDILVVVDYLQSRKDVLTDRIGVTGFCFGGSMAFYTAIRLSSEIALAAPFYGVVLDEWLAGIKDIAVPIYLFFGGVDPFISQKRIQQLDAQLQELNKNYQLKVYPDADHGFFCHERSSYNQSAAEDSWQELKGFLQQCLQDRN